MKRYAAFTIRGTEEQLDRLFSLAHGAAKVAKIISGTLYIDDLDEDTDVFHEIETILKNQKLSYSFAELRDYTKHEMMASQFFEMRVIYPWETDGKVAENFGTKYERSCSSCIYGRRQVSTLTFNSRKVGRYDIVSLPPAIIINERLRDILLRSDITGYDIQPVVDTRVAAESKFYQLVIGNVLPPLSEKVRYEYDLELFCDECRSCGRAVRSDMVYESYKTDDAKDFNLTNESFGFSNQCQPSIIVSKKLYDLFHANKVKRVFFEPVRLID